MKAQAGRLFEMAVQELRQIYTTQPQVVFDEAAEEFLGVLGEINNGPDFPGSMVNLQNC